MTGDGQTNDHSLKIGRIHDEHNQDISDAVGNGQELHQTLTQATEIVSLQINSFNWHNY